MFKGTILAVLSASLAFNAYAAPVALPGTGLLAGFMTRDASPPIIEIRDGKGGNRTGKRDGKGGNRTGKRDSEGGNRLGKRDGKGGNRTG